MLLLSMNFYDELSYFQFHGRFQVMGGNFSRVYDMHVQLMYFFDVLYLVIFLIQY